MAEPIEDVITRDEKQYVRARDLVLAWARKVNDPEFTKTAEQFSG